MQQKFQWTKKNWIVYICILWYLVIDSSGGKPTDTLSGGGSGGTIFLLFGSISGVLSLNINGGNVFIFIFFYLIMNRVQK